jgi:hypothetical protein
VTFRFRTRAPLRALAEYIAIDVEGLADVSGYIDEFVDVSTEAVNESATPGGQFSLSGHKIKVAGTDSSVGVYFVPESDPAAKVKAEGHLAENTAARVIGIIPNLSAGKYKVAIVTQYTTGAALLKEPRTIESAWAVTVA